MDQPTVLNFLRQKKIIVIAVIVILVLLLAITLLSIISSKNTNKSNPATALQSSGIPGKTSNNNLTPSSGTGRLIQKLIIPDNSQSGRIIAKVGEESIYQKDFDYIVTTNFAGSIVVQGKSETEIKSYINNLLVEESLILQYGQKQGLVKLDNTIFNNLNKSLVKRKTVVENLRKSIQGKTELVTYSGIMIWYYNVNPPQIPADQAKQIAKTKLDNLYTDLIQNKITIEQAGELIRQDNELAQIDPAYKANAFFRNIDTPFDSLRDEIKNVLANLKPNEYTNVLAFNQNTSKIREEYYTVIKLENKKGSGSFSDWLVNAKQLFPVKIY